CGEGLFRRIDAHRDCRQNRRPARHYQDAHPHRIAGAQESICMKEHTQYAEGLALYALGALDNAQERADLEAHLSSCRECQQELAALRGDAALLSLSTVGPAPPQRSRQRLLDAIAKEPGTVIAPRRSVLGVLRPRWLNFVPIAA